MSSNLVHEKEAGYEMSEQYEDVDNKIYQTETAEQTALGDDLFEADRELSIWQAIGAYPRICLYALAACAAGMNFGYDQIVNGASVSLPSFLLYFGAMTPEHELYLPSVWASLWTAMSALMQAVGGICVGYVSDRLGRKWTAFAFCFLSAGGIAIQFASHSRGMLLAGKMVNGFAIGAILAVATAWASEISPIRLRGPIQSAIVLFTVLMQALGLVVLREYVTIIEQTAFRHVFAIQWAFAGLTAVLFAIAPESPTWLILKNRDEDAKKSMQRLYGSNNHEARYRHLRHEIKVEAAAEHAHGIGSYLDLFRGSNLKRTLTVMLVFFGVGLCGASFLAQSIYFLIIAGLPAVHTFDVSIGGFALAVFAIIGSWVYIEKVGRRSLWLIGTVVNCVIMVIIGGLYYAPGKGPIWAIAILMNVLVTWQNTTLTSVSWVVAGEISAYRLRGKNQSIAVMSNSFTTWLFNFILPYIYNVDAGNLGARTGFVFAAASAVLFLASYFVVPDLRGFATDEIDWLYESKISVRKFQEHNDGRAREGVAAITLQRTRTAESRV
ncbi:hypothetical protein MBLNU459_g7012t1 [Dothideomycetes sp. NU459]